MVHVEQEYKVIATFDATGERLPTTTYTRTYNEITEQEKDALLAELAQDGKVIELLTYQRMKVQWNGPTGKRKGWVNV